MFTAPAPTSLVSGPRLPTHDVAFDNNALSTWLLDPQQRGAVLARARTTAARLVVPVLALCETAKTGNAKARARLAAIDELLVRQPAPLVIGADLREVMRAELAAPQRRVLTMPRAEAREAIRALLSGRAGAAVAKYLALDETMRRDAEARAEARSATPTPTVANVQSAKPKDAMRVIPELIGALDQPGIYGIEELFPDAPAAVAAVRRDPHRHRAAILAAAGLVLHHCGVLFPDAATRGVHFPVDAQRLAVLLRPDTNDWIDLRIAASCAHARVLVTDDGGLRDRVDYTASKGWSTPRTASLESWLDGRV